jgi:hypothetical protein
MKPLVLFLGACIAIATEAGAQTPSSPIARGDVAVHVGWLNGHQTRVVFFDDDYHRALFSGGAGFYWTDNLKTEIEAGLTNDAELFSSEQVTIDGQLRFVSSISDFRTRRVSIAQIYQSGRNQWFHPFIGAGAELVSGRTKRRDFPVEVFDPIARSNRRLRDARDYPAETDNDVRALAIGGFKAYFTPRVFFRADTRVTFGRDLEAIAFRIGGGLDF